MPKRDLDLLDMEFKNLLTILGLFLLLCSSCSPYNKLRRDFNNGKSSVDYIHTSELGIAKNDRGINISNPIISDKLFTSMGVVTKKQNTVTPLIIYNEWKNEYGCRIGRNLIKEDLSDFIKSATLEESKRTGSYRIDNTPTASLILEIEVDSLNAAGPFVNKGFFIYLVFGYALQKEELAGPGKAYSRFRYRVRDGETIFLENSVSSEANSESLKLPGVAFKKLHEIYRAHLIELLSETFKQNIEKIVLHINQVNSNLSKTKSQ